MINQTYAFDFLDKQKKLSDLSNLTFSNGIYGITIIISVWT